MLDKLFLPNEISPAERAHLEKVNRGALFFFLAHLPAFVTVAWVNHTGPALAAVLTLLVLVGPLAATVGLPNPRHISVVHGITSMLMGGLLVHFGQGPVQIEMHFYFFALLAMLAIFANPLAIVAAAVTVALHHLALWALLPSSVFNYDAPFWVVAVHAGFVVGESIVTCIIARNFFDKVIELEKVIQARTAELDARNADMRLVLDNVEQGFLSVGLDGRLGSEQSAVVKTWFAEAADAETLPGLLEAVAPDVALAFEFGFDEVVAGVMPLELTLTQLPARFEAKGRHFALEYRPIMAGDDLHRLLVVISDATAVVERERLEAAQRETVCIFERVMKDKAGFLEFFEEAEGLVEAVASDELVGPVQRDLHTLKGNCGIFGIQSVASLCHDIETRLAEQGGGLTAREREELSARWERVRTNLRTLLGERASGVIEVEDEDYERALRALLDGAAQAEVARMLGEWRLESFSRRAKRIEEQAQSLASRLGKGPLQVVVEDAGVRFDPGQWAGFWSALVHAVRNAVDHGVESPGERAALGKGRATLCLRARHSGAAVEFTLADDGRGIDWERLRQRAAARGLPAATRVDLERAMFEDGVSTAATATDISGRGIGMAALRREVEALEGTVGVESTPGQGTTLRFKFPARALGHDLVTARLAA